MQPTLQHVMVKHNKVQLPTNLTFRLSGKMADVSLVRFKD